VTRTRERLVLRRFVDRVTPELRLLREREEQLQRAAMIEALRRERDGYVRKGRAERAAEVEAELAARSGDGAVELASVADLERVRREHELERERRTQVEALLRERDQLVLAGKTERVAEVDAELHRLGYGAKPQSTRPRTTGHR